MLILFIIYFLKGLKKITNWVGCWKGWGCGGGVEKSSFSEITSVFLVAHWSVQSGWCCCRDKVRAWRLLCESSSSVQTHRVPSPRVWLINVSQHLEVWNYKFVFYFFFLPVLALPFCCSPNNCFISSLRTLSSAECHQSWSLLNLNFWCIFLEFLVPEWDQFKPPETAGVSSARTFLEHSPCFAMPFSVKDPTRSSPFSNHQGLCA